MTDTNIWTPERLQDEVDALASLIRSWPQTLDEFLDGDLSGWPVREQVASYLRDGLYGVDVVYGQASSDHYGAAAYVGDDGEIVVGGWYYDADADEDVISDDVLV